MLKEKQECEQTSRRVVMVVVVVVIVVVVGGVLFRYGMGWTGTRPRN